MRQSSICDGRVEQGKEQDVGTTNCAEPLKKNMKFCNEAKAWTTYQPMPSRVLACAHLLQARVGAWASTIRCLGRAGRSPPLLWHKYRMYVRARHIVIISGGSGAAPWSAASRPSPSPPGPVPPPPCECPSRPAPILDAHPPSALCPSALPALRARPASNVPRAQPLASAAAAWPAQRALHRRMGMLCVLCMLCMLCMPCML